MTASTEQDTTHLPQPLLRWELGGGRVLRLARTSEYAQVAHVLQEAFTTGCWVTPTYLAHLADVGPRSATSHVWVVADEEGVLGAVLTPKPQHHLPEWFSFNVLAVSPRGRGLNLGWQLVDHSVAVARALGYPGLEIRSSPQMTAAHDLYYRYGFVRRPEHEIAVVDSGQRLFAFTYRVTDPAPAAPIAYQQPTRAWAFPGSREENHVDLTGLRPRLIDQPRPAIAAYDPGLVLRVAPASLRGRAATIVVRLLGEGHRIEWSADEAADPTLVAADGGETRPDWRALSRGFARGTGPLYPERQAAQIDALVDQIHTDLVIGIETALFASERHEGQAALRLYYARLGWFDSLLSERRFLVGERVTVADIELLSVLVGLDFQHRSHLPGGAAAVADYPALFDYARRLVGGNLLAPAVLSAVGLTLGTQPPVWGEPAPVEGIDDLRAAWLTPPGAEGAVA